MGGGRTATIPLEAMDRPTPSYGPDLNPRSVSAAKQLSRELEKLPVDVVYLFGSQAEGTGGPRSDVDIGIIPKTTVPEEGRLHLQAQVSAIAADHYRVERADVVLVDEAPPAIAMAAIRGLVLLCHDENRRIITEASVMSQYHDRAYARKRWYREVPPRWARGEFA